MDWIDLAKDKDSWRVIIFPQSVKKFPAFYGTRSSITAFTTAS